jgi:hypothetical protein
MRLKPKLIFVVAIAAVSVSVAVPQFSDSRSDRTNIRSTETNGKRDISIVLYEGPLIHDQNWLIKAGVPGPDNQSFRAFGGTCSMIPADVHNASGSGFERVTFEAVRQDLGVWKMTWTDTVTGTASDIIPMRIARKMIIRA